MNKRIKSGIIYAVFILAIIITTFTPMVGKDELINSEKNISVPFHGINFDKPTNISKLNISRGRVNELGEELVSYDISFEYTGEDTSMRVMGKLAGQAFFPEAPSFSKATIKGEYGAVNDLLFGEKLILRDYYKNIESHRLESISEIRVPLSEEVGEYQFRLLYKPFNLVYRRDEKLSDMAVFVTNTRVDKFTELDNDEDLHTESFIESGMYVNLYERYNKGKVGRIELASNIFIAIFVLSVLAMLFIIWREIYNPLATVAIMIVTSLTFYKFINQGVSSKGVLLIAPILGILSVVLGKQINREDIRFNKYDISQGLLGGVILLVLGIIIYILPSVL